MSKTRAVHPGLTGFVVLAVSAILGALQPVHAQAPPRDRSVPGHRVESSRPVSETPTPHAAAAHHPLDPLEPDELLMAVATVRKKQQLSESVRFVTVTLA